MATYSKTIQVYQAVTGSTTSSATLYTAPANGYAIVNLFEITSTGTTTVTVGTRRVPTDLAIYVGPSQALACTITGTATVSVSGVEFRNT